MSQRMRVCNVATYNNSLKKRGDIFSILDQAVKFWRYCDVEKVTKSKYIYSQVLMNLMGCLRYLLRFPFCHLAGFLESYLYHKRLSGLKAPNYSTLCRRIKKEKFNFKDHRSDVDKTNSRYVSLLIDSSGINIYATGGGHGKANAKTRLHKHYDQVRKLHVLLDLETGDVLDMEITEGATSDHLTGVALIENCNLCIESIYADTVYDSQPFRAVCHLKGAKQIIPPLSNARLRKSTKKEHPTLWEDRNEAVKIIQSFSTQEEGKKRWKEQAHYGKRAKIEGFFHRFKKTFGFYFMSQSETARHNEAVFKVSILNAFNQFPKPIFQKIEVIN